MYTARYAIIVPTAANRLDPVGFFDWLTFTRAKLKVSAIIEMGFTCLNTAYLLFPTFVLPPNTPKNTRDQLAPISCLSYYVVSHANKNLTNSKSNTYTILSV